MPIQENSGVSRSVNATRKEKPSVTSGKEAAAAVKQSTNGISKPIQSEMTKAEALAVLWTGVEALAGMKTANLYHSPKTGRVVIELLETNYVPTQGLVCIGGQT